MLAGHSNRLCPHRLGGAAAVAGLHGVVLSLALAIDTERSPPQLPRALEVRLMEAPGRRTPEPALPAVVPALQPPPALNLPALPEIAFELRPAPVSVQPDAAPPAGPPPGVVHERAAQLAEAATAPVHVRHVEYAYFEPPAYPPLSRRLGERGLVVVRVRIDESGRPVEVAVSVSSGFARLDAAAVRAVRAARFRPYVEGDRARPAYALVPIRFDLS